MRFSFNHVGIGVADIDAGVAFYRDALGCRVLRPPFEVRHDGPDGAQAVDVLRSRPFRKMMMAHLVADDSIGIELFQLIDPPHEARTPPLEYWKSGLFHICLTAPDIERALQKILDMGGVQTSRIWRFGAADSSNKMVYCADPWGTAIELYNYPYVATYGAS